MKRRIVFQRLREAVITIQGRYGKTRKAITVRMNPNKFSRMMRAVVSEI
ncbi:MAG: hypothetical protein GX759_05630 [Thermoanaerobacterales bacterium]|nr:hypothetical protein [Thermoanaerobacterales bacterium]